MVIQTCHLNVYIPFGTLTWQWKIHHLKMYFPLNIGIFQCHVSFQGRTYAWFELWTYLHYESNNHLMLWWTWNYTIQAACESCLLQAPWACQWMFGMPRNLKIGSVMGFMNPVAIFGHSSEHAYCIYCTNAQIHCLEHFVCVIFTWWIVTSHYS